MSEKEVSGIFLGIVQDMAGGAVALVQMPDSGVLNVGLLPADLANPLPVIQKVMEEYIKASASKAITTPLLPGTKISAATDVPDEYTISNSNIEEKSKGG